MAIQLVLSAQKILDHVFPGVPRGYDPLLVDQFLDQVIQDYQVIEANSLLQQKDVDAMKAHIESLKKENQDLKIELGKYRSRFANIKDSDVVTSDNLELIKKLNKYEAFLYHEGYDLNSIK